MFLKASCFAVKQQFYGHFLVTRIIHLATEKKFQSPLGARIKKLISDPALHWKLFVVYIGCSRIWKVIYVSP